MRRPDVQLVSVQLQLEFLASPLAPRRCPSPIPPCPRVLCLPRSSSSPELARLLCSFVPCLTPNQEAIPPSRKGSSFSHAKAVNPDQESRSLVRSKTSSVIGRARPELGTAWFLGWVSESSSGFDHPLKGLCCGGEGRRKEEEVWIVTRY